MFIMVLLLTTEQETSQSIYYIILYYIILYYIILHQYVNNHKLQ